MTEPTPAAKIDAIIAKLRNWRGETIATLRAAILEAVPDIVVEIKWRKPTNLAGVPCWSHGGKLICTGETYKDKVKLTFAQGGSLPDPANPFNASLDGGTRRAIDVREGHEIDEVALVALIRSELRKLPKLIIRRSSSGCSRRH